MELSELLSAHAVVEFAWSFYTVANLDVQVLAHVWRQQCQLGRTDTVSTIEHNPTACIGGCVRSLCQYPNNRISHRILMRTQYQLQNL